MDRDDDDDDDGRWEGGTGCRFDGLRNKLFGPFAGPYPAATTTTPKERKGKGS